MEFKSFILVNSTSKTWESGGKLTPNQKLVKTKLNIQTGMGLQ